MIELVGLWSYALAALLYGGLAIWQWRAGQSGANRPLAAAFAANAVWAALQGFAGSDAAVALLAESVRNLAFLGCLYLMVRGAGTLARQGSVKAVYGAVAGAIFLQAALALLSLHFGPIEGARASASHSLGLAVAAGLLILVHNLYGQASPASRATLQLPVIALAAMAAYDLHLYTFASLTGQEQSALAILRGSMSAALVPLFVLAGRRDGAWRVQLSRSATFQSLSLIGILAYLLAMMSLSRAMETMSGGWVQFAQLGIILGMTVAALLLLPSGRVRAWLRVMVSKHFFEHRYDYRSDWLRFTRAVGRAGEDGTPLGERVVKALADMAGSPGGLLLTADEGHRLLPAARWNWRHEDEPSGEATEALVRFLETSSYVIDFTMLREGGLDRREIEASVPDWLRRAEEAWAGIPLVHNDRLVGLVILDRPVSRGPLDWEDYDLFRTAGMQAASYIAEAQSQAALANAQRFDEFNRRFAFILHDIKNLVSQLSLVARNAERHADNPEFRADMVATLQSSVKKMNDLLARLSRGNVAEAQPLRPILVQPIVTAVAEARRRQHPVEVEGDARLAIQADPARLEQALAHLVQNAVEASGADAPVTIAFRAVGDEVEIEVADRGTGMSDEFVRTRLFQPFASTKDNGFGIGAFESRMLIAAMGGRLDVASREGEGSRFTIHLPAGAAEAAPLPHPKQRMRA